MFGRPQRAAPTIANGIFLIIREPRHVGLRPGYDASPDNFNDSTIQRLNTTLQSYKRQLT